MLRGNALSARITRTFFFNIHGHKDLWAWEWDMHMGRNVPGNKISPLSWKKDVIELNSSSVNFCRHLFSSSSFKSFKGIHILLSPFSWYLIISSSQWNHCRGNFSLTNEKFFDASVLITCLKLVIPSSSSFSEFSTAKTTSLLNSRTSRGPNVEANFLSQSAFASARKSRSTFKNK